MNYLIFASIFIVNHLIWRYALKKQALKILRIKEKFVKFVISYIVSTLLPNMGVIIIGGAFMNIAPKELDFYFYLFEIIPFIAFYEMFKSLLAEEDKLKVSI